MADDDQHKAAVPSPAVNEVQPEAAAEQSKTGNAPSVHEAADPSPDAELVRQGLDDLEKKNVKWYSYFTTVDFWVVLLLGQVLALCITGTNTFSSLLAEDEVNIPSFQVMFTYILLFIIYTPLTLYRLGPRE